MAKSSAFSIIALTTVLFLLTLKEGTGVFKLTKFYCQSHDESWLVYNQCSLRAINRTVTVLNVNSTIKHPIYNTTINLYFLKRANGYKPFLGNLTFDFCKYLQHRNHPMVNMLFKIFKDNSNINHSCPYVGDLVVKNFYLQDSFLKLPLPDGDYGLILNYIGHGRLLATQKIFFVYEST